MPWDDRIRRRLKLRDLDILMAVIQAGSMGKAADHFNMTQPAVSKVVAELEATFGVRLLDRSRQGVEPTSHGRALIKRGIAVFDELRQTVQDLDFLSDPTAGELRIGSNQPLAEGLIVAVIDRLSRRYPRVAFSVVMADARAICRELRERRIDLGFARLSGLDPEKDMEQEALFEEPLAVVAGMDNSWSRRRKIKLAELVNEPWTWPSPGTIIDSLVVEAFRASGLEAPRASVYADSFNMRTKLAATGRFLAVVHASMLQFPAKDSLVKKLSVELPTTHRQIGIITLKNRTLGPVARLFIEIAREVAKPLAKR